MREILVMKGGQDIEGEQGVRDVRGQLLQCEAELAEKSMYAEFRLYMIVLMVCAQSACRGGYDRRSSIA